MINGDGATGKDTKALKHFTFPYLSVGSERQAEETRIPLED